MDEKTFVALENAAFQAWPALQPNELFLGWRLRYSGGSTKRTNSANAGLEAADLTLDQIGEIEQRYRQRGLPVIFRITSFASPSHIDGVLEQRGYRLVDPTWVMTLSMQSAAGGVSLRALSIDAWLESYRQITGDDSAGKSAHLERVQSGNKACAFAVEYAEGVAASCGIGVVSGQQMGLFAVATAQAQRKKGLATVLCRNLLAWGKMHGAGEAYLQVDKSNHGAISIYENLGFRPAYDYWYRVGS